MLRLKLQKRSLKWSHDPEQEVYVSSMWLYYLLSVNITKLVRTSCIRSVFVPIKSLVKRTRRIKTTKKYRKKTKKSVETITHEEFLRRKIQRSQKASRFKGNNSVGMRFLYDNFPNHMKRTNKRHYFNTPIIQFNPIIVQESGVKVYNPDTV